MSGLLNGLIGTFGINKPTVKTSAQADLEIQVRGAFQAGHNPETDTFSLELATPPAGHRDLVSGSHIYRQVEKLIQQDLCGLLYQVIVPNSVLVAARVVSPRDYMGKHLGFIPLANTQSFSTPKLLQEIAPLAILFSAHLYNNGNPILPHEFGLHLFKSGFQQDLLSRGNHSPFDYLIHPPDGKNSLSLLCLGEAPTTNTSQTILHKAIDPFLAGVVDAYSASVTAPSDGSTSTLVSIRR